ncbi:hypothetical protein NDU88_000728 [Pleurodeles waltl]|uniref:Uncharacterized protein n=1 Tax=Pleurodeles waltl TaxID=8319 RepID=A0AAV7S8N6_PLEWA|nr:hypothetical protein NDU88_000728 [Pleurodeles waltl]
MAPPCEALQGGNINLPLIRADRTPKVPNLPAVGRRTLVEERISEVGRARAVAPTPPRTLAGVSGLEVKEHPCPLEWLHGRRLWIGNEGEGQTCRPSW